MCVVSWQGCWRRSRGVLLSCARYSVQFQPDGTRDVFVPVKCYIQTGFPFLWPKALFWICFEGKSWKSRGSTLTVLPRRGTQRTSSSLGSLAPFLEDYGRWYLVNCLLSSWTSISQLLNSFSSFRIAALSAGVSFVHGLSARRS